MLSKPQVVLLVLVGCNGLSIDPEALGQTGRSSVKVGQSSDVWQGMKQGGEWFGNEVNAAEEAARLARLEAERAQQELDTNMTLRQIEAADAHAKAESRKEYINQDRLQDVSSSMNQEFGVTLKEVAEETKHEEAVDKRKQEAYNQFMKKMDRVFDADEEKTTWELAKGQHQQLAQERMETKQEKIQAKEIAQMNKELQKAEAHEKIHKKHSKEIEAEMSARLWDEADSLRVDASNLSDGALSQDDVLSLLDISSKELARMTEAVSNLNLSGDTGAWFEERLRGVRSRSTTASAHLLHTITENVHELKNHQMDFTNTQLQRQIVRLLNETRNEVKLLQLESNAINKRIDGWGRASPEKLSLTLAGALNGVTNNVEFRNHLFEVDLNHLSLASQTEACKMLSALFMENMQPAYRSLWRMREKLDMLTKVVPSVLADAPQGMDAMANRTRDVLNMAYAEHLAFEQASKAVLAEAGPIMVERLGCVFSGTSHAASGLSALLAAAAGWLALW
jgi:hypothetical protein